MSKASQIAAALNARIEAITIANGYSTNIGAQVYRGRLSLDPSELPCAVMVEGEDQVEDRTKIKVKLAQRYVFEGHSECNPLQPNDTAHLILADIKRALFTGDLTLGGLIVEMRYIGRSIGARPDGTAIVAASVEIEAVFAEDLTNP